MRQKSFVDLAAYRNASLTVSGSERAEQLSGTYITANAFGLLPVQPAMGRLFRAGEDQPGAEKVALLSHGLWQNRYNSDAAILGKSIRVNGVPSTIVGVMPPGFQFPYTQQIWLPLDVDPLQTPRGTAPGHESLEVFGRLRADATLEQAQLELNRIALQLEQEHPESNKNVRAALGLLTSRYIGEQASGLLLTMLGAVFLVLLVACTNVASLLLGRAVMRSKEVGIRTALGATRGRLVTQFLTESLVLALAGSALGIVLALYGVRAFNGAIASANIPYWAIIKVDDAALLLVLGLTALCALLAGTIPALQAARSRVGEVLKDASRGASSFRLGRISRALVVLEIGLSGGLLVAAGLTIKSVVKLRNIDLGFESTQLFTAQLQLPDTRYADPQRRVAFYDEVVRRVSAIPGVSSATVTTALPGVGAAWGSFALEGATYQRPQDYPSAHRISITPDFFRTLGAQPVAGRAFNTGDGVNSLPVAIVNEPFVRTFFPGLARPDQAVGQRIRVDNGEPTARWLSIVGVVPDLTAGELAESRLRAPAWYVPMAQTTEPFASIIARSSSDPLVLSSEIRDVMASMDADLAIAQSGTLRGAVERDTWFIPLFGGLFMIFGGAALCMAVIGLYAVTAFSVSQRTRELGIRMAMGARAGDVMRMVLRQGLLQVGMGTVIGLALALALAQLLAVIMFDVQPRDPLIYGGVIAVLGTTAIVACLVPARRATRVHPTEALRHE
jgi:predicted permease